MEGGHCSDVSYLEKVRENRQQHAKLEEALGMYGYNVTSLAYICGSTGSQYHRSNDTTHMLGIDHSVAKKLGDKVYKRTVACADKLMQPCKMLERSRAGHIGRRPRANPPPPPRSMTMVTPTELLSWDSSLGLP